MLWSDLVHVKHVTGGKATFQREVGTVFGLGFGIYGVNSNTSLLCLRFIFYIYFLPSLGFFLKLFN